MAIALEREVGYLTAHSMLHLLGYDHETSGIDKMHMREKGRACDDPTGLPGSAASYFMDEDE